MGGSIYSCSLTKAFLHHMSAFLKNTLVYSLPYRLMQGMPSLLQAILQGSLFCQFVKRFSQKAYFFSKELFFQSAETSKFISFSRQLTNNFQANFLRSTLVFLLFVFIGELMMVFALQFHFSYGVFLRIAVISFLFIAFMRTKTSQGKMSDFWQH